MHPLLVPVAFLPAEGRSFTVQLSCGEVDAHLRAGEVPDVRAVAPAAGELRVLPSGADVFVLGTLRGRLEYRCVRCLRPFERDLAAEFQVVFSPEPDFGGGERELHREDLEVEPLPGGELDLTRVTLEQLDLATADHPVCAEGCQGLCPGCGGDRNAAECRCEESPVDPRLAVLRGWGKTGGAEQS